MDRGSLFVAVLLLLCVASIDSVLRMCARCECTYKDGIIRIDCNNQQLSETHLHQIQNNPNTSFVALNFSNNNFSKVPVGLNTHGVQFLDLSNNNISNLNNLNNFSELVELNLAYNNIDEFESQAFELPFLMLLNMSHCSLRNLSGFGNSSLHDLITLDLSRNRIENLDEEYLSHMTKLHYLDLSNNIIKKLDVLYFKNLHILNVENNMIGPEFKFPSTLLELNAQNNLINELFMNEALNDTNSLLVFLYVNQNKLTMLPNTSYPNLKILDLSKNEFKTVPEVLNEENCPNLEILDLSENNFEHFEINSNLKLTSLKVNQVKSIRKLKKDTLMKLKNYPNNCINITMKNNPELHTVENDSFQHLNLCFLDLENNSLGNLPQIKIKSGDWRNIKYGINFQLNPVVCDCQSQWLLDEFVSFYKNTNLEYLIENIRCAEPYYTRDLRLVHWYNWNNSIFCQDEATIISRMSVSESEHPFGEIFLQSSGTMLLVVTICTAILATLFVVGLVLAKRAAVRRMRRNRRF